MPTQDEVDEARRAAQKAVLDRIALAAAPNTSLTFPNLETLARAYRYASGGPLPTPPETDK